MSERTNRLAQWQVLYDDSTEPPKPVPLHAESPRWRAVDTDWNKESIWREQASCAGLPVKNNPFFPHEGETYKKAISYCIKCPVRTECAESELSRKEAFSFGMWGGLTAQDRNKIMQARRSVLYPISFGNVKHGGKQGFKRHVEIGEVPCQECSDGWLPLRPMIKVVQST